MVCSKSHHIHHDDVIKWKHFPRYWTFVRGIHRSPVNSPHKGQWCGALMFSYICAWWLSKQSWGWRFEKPSHPLWCHCNDYFKDAHCFYSLWKLFLQCMPLATHADYDDMLKPREYDYISYSNNLCLIWWPFFRISSYGDPMRAQWHHGMKMIYALLALCEIWRLFVINLDKLFNKQSGCRYI